MGLCCNSDNNHTSLNRVSQCSSYYRELAIDPNYHKPEESMIGRKLNFIWMGLLSYSTEN